MAGAGRAPKPSSRRSGRGGKATVSLTVSDGEVPPWPLPPDVSLQAELDVIQSTLEAVVQEIETEEDGRKLGALRRKHEALAIREARVRRTIALSDQLEEQLWESLWRLPQAGQWRRLQWTRDVAQYVRHKVRGEGGDLDHAKEARQWSDRLGLTPRAASVLGWEVPESGDSEPDKASGGSSRGSRSRHAGLKLAE